MVRTIQYNFKNLFSNIFKNHSCNENLKTCKIKIVVMKQHLHKVIRSSDLNYIISFPPQYSQDFSYNNSLSSQVFDINIKYLNLSFILSQSLSL